MKTKTSINFGIFQYVHGHTFMHRMPALIKLFIMFAASIALFNLPITWCAAAFAVFMILSFVCRIPFLLQIADMQIGFYNFLLFYLLSLWNTHSFVPLFSDILQCSRILVTLQCSSLLFRTTSPLSLQNALEDAELAVRKVFHLAPKTSFAEVLSFFLLFIPRIFDIIFKVNKAYKARSTKGGIRKILAVVPVVISLTMNSAFRTARAVAARSTQEN